MEQKKDPTEGNMAFHFLKLLRYLVITILLTFKIRTILMMRNVIYSLVYPQNEGILLYHLLKGQTQFVSFPHGP